MTHVNRKHRNDKPNLPLLPSTSYTQSLPSPLSSRSWSPRTRNQNRWVISQNTISSPIRSSSSPRLPSAFVRSVRLVPSRCCYDNIKKLTTIIVHYCVLCARQLFSYSNIGTVNAVTGVISPTNLSLLSNPGGSPSSSSGGGGAGRSRGHSQTTLPRWNTQCSSGQPFITLDEDYMMTPLMSGNGGQGNAGTLIDDGNIKLMKYRFESVIMAWAMLNSRTRSISFWAVR